MVWLPDTTYDDLPPLPPLAELETRRVLKSAINARDALVRLDASARTLPNPSIIINAIPLLEAQASSEIENIVTTTDELFAAAATDNASPAAREALRYRSALRRGFEQLGERPLTARTAIEVCATIRGHDVEVRRGEVYVGDPVSRRRVYTPPRDPTTVDRLLDNWSAFLNDDSDLDPVVRMAVAHYQFEAIHPFTDGNGRTGRIMNVLMLCDAGLLQMPLLYLSRHIVETKDEYYRLLLAVTAEGAWEDWITYVLDGVGAIALRTLELVGQIETVRAEILEIARAAIGTANHDLVTVLMEQPYARVRDVIARCHVSRPTATKWLRAMTSAGVLRDLRVGREVLFINRPLMAVLSS